MAELERVLMNGNNAAPATQQPHVHMLQQQQQQQQQHRQNWQQQLHHPQPPPPLQSQPTLQPQHAGDMAAFNKLLDLMKISGQLSESPKMPVSDFIYFSSHMCQHTPLIYLRYSSRTMSYRFRPDQLGHLSPREGGRWNSVHW